MKTRFTLETVINPRTPYPFLYNIYIDIFT